MAYLPNTMNPPLTGEPVAAPRLNEEQGSHRDASTNSPGIDAAAAQRVSVIVPTRNESANIEPLLRRLESGAGSLIDEVIFVDDSTDETVQVIERQQGQFPFAVRVIARPPARRNGLGKAVVEGMQAATAPWVLVMDGDLQHPPEVIPQLLDKALANDANLVAGSRLAKGGGTDGLSPTRTLISKVLAFSSRTLFPHRLRQLTDPLTGFFLVRREVLNPADLKPEGFKILLEVLVRTPGLRVAEVPFQFGERHGGESKANSTEVLRLFRQMIKLSLIAQKRLIQFATVGLTGILVNTLLLILFTEGMGVHYLLSAVLATQGSSLWNFFWTERWVFGDRQQGGSWVARLLVFLGINNVMLLARGPMLAFFVGMLAIHYVVGNLLTIAIMTLVRYAIADRLIWKKSDSAGAYHYYNVHDIVRVRSAKRLPELGYFKVDGPLNDVDIDVTVDSDLAAYRRDGSICYDEVLGPFGFSIVINHREDSTHVAASPLVGMSPHVLYTNVVEPLLRWTFVRKGYALMHGATLAFDNQAMFITARTDTGKTTTILHTLRSNTEASGFLSDDMTIIGPDGMARSFPKPLTISKHTLQAIGGAPLSRWQYAALQIQSRIHSREGRAFAMIISKFRLPAATINTIVQMIIPPPKYMVDKLVPGAQYVPSAPLKQVVVIERGKDYEAPLPDSEKFATLFANAEDAYGFPPYPQLRHLLASWNGQDLHSVEQATVSAAVNNLPATLMGSSCFDWYKRLPKVIGENAEALQANGSEAWEASYGGAAAD